MTLLKTAEMQGEKGCPAPQNLTLPLTRVPGVQLRQEEPVSPGVQTLMKVGGAGGWNQLGKNRFLREPPRKVGGDPEASTDRKWGWPNKNRGMTLQGSGEEILPGQ